MKRKLFLLNAFLSSSLVTGVTLNVISCKKAVKITDDSNETTEIVIREKIVLIKQKINSIIDDYTTNIKNEDNKDWIIGLDQVQFGEEKMKLLKKAVEEIKDSSGGKLVSEIDPVLNEIIKRKINQLSQYVTDKIKRDKKLDLPSDFQVEINNDFEPILTNFTSINFLETLKKLLNTSLLVDPLKQANFTSKIYQNFLMNNDQNDEVNKLIKPDIFKINTNFFYTFNYAEINETDVYKDNELLITGDINNTNILKNYANEQIQKIFNDLMTKQQVLIYDAMFEGNISNQNYKNLNYKFNWDFNNPEVQNEIIDIQVKKIRRIISKNPILNLLKFDQEETKYELFDAMKFSNESVKKPLTTDDNTVNLVYGDENNSKITPFLSIKKNLLKQLGISEKPKDKTDLEMYYFNKNDENKYWDGGEINKAYVALLKKQNRIKEFYNNGQYLVGYGNLLIPRITFSGLRLSPLTIKTDLAIEETAFSGMIDSLLKYLEGLVSTLQNSGELDKLGYKIAFSLGDAYMLQWKFYGKEWLALEKEVAIKGKVSFEWIMKNIIYKLRASSLKDRSTRNIIELDQYWENDAIPEEAIDGFNTVNEIWFTKFSETGLAAVSDSSSTITSKGLYFKFGPFSIFLSGSSPAFWNNDSYGTTIVQGK